MTFSWAQVDKLAKACLEISSNAADHMQFVSVRNLLDRFDAELILRPLLVEAMLCEKLPDSINNDALTSSRWTLLVDSEKYPISNEEVRNESIEAPLMDRFRNTVAHELAHSLAFRAEEFGVKLLLDSKRSKKSREAEVADIERHTERMSPLLLIPNEALDQRFSTSTPIPTAQAIAAARRNFGVSRHVLINRLNLLESYAPHLLTRACLLNVAIGIGSWTKSGDYVLSGWPIFANFDRNIIPAFIHAVRQKKTLPLVEALGSQPGELVNGGGASLRVPAGVGRNPIAENLEISLSIEKRTSGFGRPSLFVVTSRR